MPIRIRITGGTGAGESYLIHKKYTRIGSDPENDFVIHAKEIPASLLILEKPGGVDYLKIHCRQSNIVQHKGAILHQGEEYLWKPGETLVLAGCSWLILDSEHATQQVASPESTAPVRDRRSPEIELENDGTDDEIDYTTVAKIAVIILCFAVFIIIALTQVVFQSDDEAHQNLPADAKIEDVKERVDRVVKERSLRESIQNTFSKAFWYEDWNTKESLRYYGELQDLLLREYGKQKEWNDSRSFDLEKEDLSDLSGLLAFVNNKVAKLNAKQNQSN